MRKKYFTALLISLAICMAANANDAVFSNSDTEKFNLEPLNYSTTPVKTTKTTSTATTVNTQNKVVGSDLANKNYTGAINNLDNAEVELREQLASYSALMAQAKTAYEAKKDEYSGYKKQYNEIKKKLSNIEKSKKLIQNNYPVNNVSN